ncbi:lysozyme inhibitor LprI family protein [Azohydromonas lata]|uniref:lysozyme inhibitor LprI family protein n=1 Tax=Azohydromonas lata TaxID=45677 RepID=UPI001470CEA0|nr:lysozyme inhibitor LprI family protein [Azohydromonas lata]
MSTSMKNCLFVLCAAFLAALPAHALDCKNAMNTMDMNDCAAIEQKAVEVRLNEVYQRVMKELDKPDEELEKYSEVRKKLLEAQRAWIRFRQSDCDAQYAYHMDGSMRNLVYLGCMRSRAERRIKDLEEYLPR